MLMAILGGDNAGGGVIWAPEVLKEAENHGLVLAEKGKIYDTKIGQEMPSNENFMKPLTEKELQNFPEYSSGEVVPNYVARYLDLYSLSKINPAKVIGEKGKIYDKPGFEVEFITENSFENIKNTYNKDVVFMPVEGYWMLNSKSYNLPKIDESLTPFLSTIPLQLLAYHVALLKKCDIDKPRNLAKSVTVE